MTPRHDPGLESEAHLRLAAARRIIDAIETGEWCPTDDVLGELYVLVAEAAWRFQRAGDCCPELLAA